MSTPKKRTGKVCAVQQAYYLEMLKGNVAFRTNKNTPINPNAIEEAWDELVGQMNSCGSGPQKSKEQWKKTFADWKSCTKKKARLQYVHSRGTGGGPSLDKQLTEMEVELIDLIGNVVVVGVPGLAEGGLNIPNEALPSEDPPSQDENDPIIQAADLVLAEISTVSNSLINPEINSEAPIAGTSATPAPFIKTCGLGVKRKRQSSESTYQKATSQYAETMQIQKETWLKVSGSLDKLANSISEFVVVKRDELEIRRQELEFKKLELKMRYPNFNLDLNNP